MTTSNTEGREQFYDRYLLPEDAEAIRARDAEIETLTEQARALRAEAERLTQQAKEVADRLRSAEFDRRLALEAAEARQHLASGIEDQMLVREVLRGNDFHRVYRDEIRRRATEVDERLFFADKRDDRVSTWVDLALDADTNAVESLAAALLEFDRRFGDPTDPEPEPQRRRRFGRGGDPLPLRARARVSVASGDRYTAGYDVIFDRHGVESALVATGSVAGPVATGTLADMLAEAQGLARVDLG